MFLRTLRITNLRSIENLELSFEGGNAKTRKWTLLLAENGTGKTTLLRAIALVMAGSDALGTLLGEIDTWIRIGKKQAKIEAQLVTADGQTRDISLTLNRGDTLGSLLERNAESVALLDMALKHAERNYFVVGYGASRRLGTLNGSRMQFAETGKSLASRADSVSTLFFNDVALYPLSTWVMQLDYQGKDLAPVKRALNALLPGTAFKRIDREKGQVLFGTPDGEVPLELLSDGYQNVAAWCGDLLRRITEAFPERTEPLHARGLLLIDEIDLHLHPQWQRKLIEFVSSQLPHFQIVCTTHSPITAQQVGPGELIVMRRPAPDQAPRLYPFEGDPRLLRIEQLIVSPLFGIETGLSRELELNRQNRTNDPSGQPPTSRGLRDAPIAGSVLASSIGDSPLEKERVELLSRINATLQQPTKKASRARGE